MTRAMVNCGDTVMELCDERAWSIVMTGPTEVCDEKGRVHCDDRVHGAL